MINPYTPSFASFELNNTQLALHRTFLGLYADPQQKLTVSAICQATPLSRSSFYDYYDHVEQLKAEVEDRIVLELMQGTGPLIKLDDLAFVEVTIDFVTRHREFFEAFLIKRPNPAFIDKWKQAIKYHFYPKLVISHPKTVDITLEILASAVVSTLTYLLK